ncbi:hypothetical protein NN6n1_01020 [Shinella zoogloeoides]
MVETRSDPRRRIDDDPADRHPAGLLPQMPREPHAIAADERNRLGLYHSHQEKSAIHAADDRAQTPLCIFTGRYT